MIRLTRVRTAPPVHNNFHGDRRYELNLGLLKDKRDGNLDGASEDKWNSGIWKEAKDQLLKEANGKCAYCETPTQVVSYGDVEHFRPKSIYWWLAYSYENYLPSCTICNQRYKKDKFPLREGYTPWNGHRITTGMSDARLESLARGLTVDPIDGVLGMSIEEFEKLMKSEWPLLVHPYFEDPEEYYAYKIIFESGEVYVVPSKNAYKDVVKAAEDVFGINRNELLNLRFQQYLVYMTTRFTLLDPGISLNTRRMQERLLNELTNATSPYAGMVRYLQKQDIKSLPWDFNF